MGVRHRRRVFARPAFPRFLELGFLVNKGFPHHRTNLRTVPMGSLQCLEPSESWVPKHELLPASRPEWANQFGSSGRLFVRTNYEYPNGSPIPAVCAEAVFLIPGTRSRQRASTITPGIQMSTGWDSGGFGTLKLDGAPARGGLDRQQREPEAPASERFPH